MKKPKHIFNSVKEDLRWGRVIDFKTREVLKENTPKENVAKRVEIAHKPVVPSENPFKSRFFNENSYQNILLGFALLILSLFFTFTTAKAQDRSPQGEFSALVEQEKTREDFEDDEVMKEFVKKEEVDFKKDR